MALPTLTPKQAGNTTVLPEKCDIASYSATERQSMIHSFPFGTYANEDYWFDASGAAASPQVD